MSRKRRGRGEGAVFQRSDGLWCARTAKVGGVARSFYGKTKAEALGKLREFKPGASYDAGNLTVKGFLSTWLDGPAATTVQPSASLRYRQCLEGKVYPRLGSLQLAKLAPFNVQELYADMERAGESPRSRQMTGTVLTAALRHAVTLKLIEHNPAMDIPKPRVPRQEMHVWSGEQVKTFLDTAKNDRLHALYVLAVSTGMREGELFGLQWADVDLDAGYLTIQRTLEELGGVVRLKEPKTPASRRRIDLPRIAVVALQSHRRRMLAEGHAANPQVFVGRRGAFLRRPNVQQRSFEKWIAKAELPSIRFHDLRHTAATLLLLAGENVKVVSERLGHASIEITLNTYAHVLPTMQAAAVRKIDAMFA